MMRATSDPIRLFTKKTARYARFIQDTWTQYDLIATALMIGRWWQSNLYNTEELLDAFRRAGFAHVTFSAFPLAALYLAAWGYIIEARK